MVSFSANIFVLKLNLYNQDDHGVDRSQEHRPIAVVLGFVRLEVRWVTLIGKVPPKCAAKK